jgi:hypothetical protein
MSGGFTTTQHLSLGDTNKPWGVCGFTSTFYAMSRMNQFKYTKWIDWTHAYSVLYEIRDYLVALQAVTSPLLQDITDFTRCFGGVHAKFTIDEYIKNIDNASATEKSAAEILKDEKFGMGLPPKVVADYITRQWKMTATITEISGSLASGDAIVGVANGSRTTPYHGLVHYLYRGGNKFYSWGAEFDTLVQANASFSIVYAITIS